jgi:hypothetical protein
MFKSLSVVKISQGRYVKWERVSHWGIYTELHERSPDEEPGYLTHITSFDFDLNAQGGSVHQHPYNPRTSGSILGVIKVSNSVSFTDDELEAVGEKVTQGKTFHPITYNCQMWTMDVLWELADRGWLQRNEVEQFAGMHPTLVNMFYSLSQATVLIVCVFSGEVLEDASMSLRETFYIGRANI